MPALSRTGFSFDGLVEVRTDAQGCVLVRSNGDGAAGIFARLSPCQASDLADELYQSAFVARSKAPKNQSLLYLLWAWVGIASVVLVDFGYHDVYSQVQKAQLRVSKAQASKGK